MKRSEQLFSIINDIDDDIIDEAKSEEQRPIQMKPEPRSPIKGIIALAACVAVLAIGIFAIVKFKLSREMDPIQNDSSEYSSSESSDNSVPDPKNDKELQELLKDLVAKAEEIDGMFGYLSPSGNKYHFDFGYSKDGFEHLENDYYLVSEDKRTNSGLFAVPQSYDEMEKLFSECFSSQAVEHYMKRVGRGTLKEERDGILYVDGGIHAFVEMNGNMYFSTNLDKPYYDGIKYRGMGIDCETAKVTRQTDTIIEFTYWGSSYRSYDEYSEKEGILVKENGTWKLRYLSYYGFAPEIPVEFTDQDLELHEILESLEPGNETTRLFMGALTEIGTGYNFVIIDSSGEEIYASYIDLSSAEQELNFPKSSDEFEQRLLQYFTYEATDRYMNNFSKGISMTQNPDGSYSVILDKNINPIYIEMDGKMYYRWVDAGGKSTSINYDTVKVIGRTDDTIVFSHVELDYGYYPKTERLVFERGGWKRDPFYDPDK